MSVSAAETLASHTGREDNIFWRRVAGEVGGLIEAAGAKSLSERAPSRWGATVIHSVTNPLGRLTAAIHVYGGDFYGVKRSDWDPENLLERDYDFALHRRMFEEANAV
jgi:predicted metal-dependent enzyme (double-stranded beta helix superfamily)